MKAMRLISLSRGGVKPSSTGTRPNNDTAASRTMAKTRNPMDLSFRLAQPSATATPSSTKANASTFCMTTTTPLTLSSSGGPGLLDRRHLAQEQLDDLWIPLMASAVDQDGDRLLERQP